MSEHSVCPWWIGYFLILPLRRIWHDPARLLAPHVRPGMVVLEPGPGMGFFTLELARRVGPSGRVIAVDIQPKMIEKLKRRAERRGLSDRIDARVVPPDSMALDDLDGAIDFVLAFAVVHELPDASRFFAKAARAMKPNADLLLVEPAGHVSEAEFAAQLAWAAERNLKMVDQPAVKGCLAAVLRKAA